MAGISNMYISLVSSPNIWHMNGYHASPNQQQYMKLEYPSMHDYSVLYGPQMCTLPLSEVIYRCLAGLRFRGDDVKSSPEVTVLFCLIEYILKNFLGGPKNAQSTQLLHMKTNTHWTQRLGRILSFQWDLAPFNCCGKAVLYYPPPPHHHHPIISPCFFRLKVFQLKLVSLVPNYCHLCWFPLRRAIISPLLCLLLSPNQLTWIISSLLELRPLPWEDALSSARRTIA